MKKLLTLIIIGSIFLTACSKKDDHFTQPTTNNIIVVDTIPQDTIPVDTTIVPIDSNHIMTVKFTTTYYNNIRIFLNNNVIITTFQSTPKDLNFAARTGDVIKVESTSRCKSCYILNDYVWIQILEDSVPIRNTKNWIGKYNGVYYLTVSITETVK